MHKLETKSLVSYLIFNCLSIEVGRQNILYTSIAGLFNCFNFKVIRLVLNE